MKRTRQNAIQAYKVNGETFYRVCFQYRGIRVKRSGFYSKDAAQHFEAEARYKIATGTWQPTVASDVERITFGDFIENIWIPQCAPLIERDNSRIRRLSGIRNHLLPQFRARKIKELRQADVTGLKAAMKAKGLSNGTINGVLSDLSAVLRDARDLGIEPRINKIRFLKHKPAPQTFLSLEELERLISAMPDGQWRNMLRLQTAMALRAGELFALTFDKVDWANNRILIDQQSDDRRKITPTKNSKAVWLPLNETAKAAIRAQMAVRDSRTGFMFLGQRTRQLLDRSSYNKCLHRAAKKAGIKKNVTSHVARRSMSNILCNSSVPITYVAAFLRNTPKVMIQQYQRVDEQKFNQAFSRIRLGLHRELPRENTSNGDGPHNALAINGNSGQQLQWDHIGTPEPSNETGVLHNPVDAEVPSDEPEDAP